MRILAIRGANLASLAAPFDIDLDGGPLGATGIFAITGETGAGKSTILDALCLALYGQFPRISAGRREDVPDPGGQPLNAGDPRAILRRGAGDGYAEVDFLGRDGVGYRVRWTAYRARGRADGRLQNETRSLSRIGDGAAIATGKTAVLAAVEAATDLTFEQFRRTVVLAQGEFDTFLLASEADRAELLEKITGTAVYSEISKRVYAGTDAQRTACATLVARHDAIGLLDVEGRAARLSERATIDAGMAALVAEQAALAAALDHSRRLVAAEAQLAAAATQVDRASASIEAGRANADRLAELDAVEPLRRSAEAVATAEAFLDATGELREKARADVEAAEAGLDAARTGHATAHAADEAGENDLRTFTPAWSAADVLDARIAELVRDAEATAAKAAETGLTLEAAKARRAALDREHDAAVAALDAAARRLATEAALAPLADRAAEIAGLFGKRVTMAAGSAAAHSSRADAETIVTAADAATATARERAIAARGTRTRLLAARAALEDQRDGLDPEAAEERHDHLRDLLERLAIASDVAARHDQASVELARVTASRGQAETARVAATDQRAIAETRRREAVRARTEIAALADLAERSVSAEAAHLRSSLLPDRPCPVCGSADHPVLHDGDWSDALTRLAEAMRGRRADVDAELAQAYADIAVAIEAGTSASARLEAAAREGTLAQAALSSATRAYAGLMPELTAACVSVGSPGTPPAVPGDGAVAGLAAISEAARAARGVLAQTLERTRSLAGEIRALGRELDAADREIVIADETISAKAGPRQAAALTAEHERTRAADLSDRVESLDRELGSFLLMAGLTGGDLGRDAGATAARVAAIGADHRDLRERHRGLETGLRELAPRRAVAIAAETTATVAAEEASTSARDRAAALGDARRTRAGLLGGEPTPVHRARFTARREVARAALRATEKAVASAAAAHALAEGSDRHASTQHGRAADALEQARGRFLTACGDRTPVAVIALLAVPPGTRTGLREARDRLLRTHEAAVTALATRRTDLDSLRDRPAIDVPGTEAKAARIADVVAAGQRRRGALDADLARDDAARGLAANLADEIRAARENLAHWEMVDAAVGSAGGDRFRRFAQGVTLEHLAQLANEQLQALSPRYALVRSRAADLSLHVLDRDMGDELRGTRSLSGGERFLVALALALALSGLEGRQNFVDTLFIDEGFGSLDAETLDMAVDALETLQGQGRRVGVITHVAAMIDRIVVQVRVERHGQGRSTVRVSDGSSTS